MEREQDTQNKYGLFGKDIGYSFSRGYFKEKFEKQEIKAQYVNFDVPDATAMQEVLRAKSAIGYNVTIPYKQDIIPFLNRLDTHAAAIGAVNTVKTEDDGTLTGYNTDYVGFRDSLLERFGESHFCDFDETVLSATSYKCLILGTGGASKAVHYAMQQLGVDCTFVSRKRSNNSLQYEDLNEQNIKDHTFIVNTTPVGTFPEVDMAPAIPYQYIGDAHIAFDLIYNPEQSTFLKKALQQSAQIINGFRMLELQAEASWSIWNS